jgi:hypothetical protein
MTSSSPSWRLVDLDGVGAVEIRPVTLRDTVGADVTDPSFIHRCVRHPGAEVYTRDEILDLPVAAANQLAAEVMKPRPTTAPSGAFGG